MNGFLDTSVLVAVFYGDHVHHNASLDLFVRFDKPTGCCAAHSLAEVYSTLTRMPGKYRISPEQAMLFIENIHQRLTIISLNPEEVITALHLASAQAIVGGGTYDALLAHCALKAEAQAIYTWNTRHYALCRPEITQRLKTP